MLPACAAELVEGDRTMKIQLNYGDIESSDALSDYVTQAVDRALERHADRVTRVEVHLRDDKQKRGGPDDNRCTMEARAAGDPPLAVEARGRDIYEVVRDCAGKLERALTRKFEKKES